MASMSSKKSFTLIELVIVIGILAVLATTVILVLNPSELLKQSRDTRRLSDLASLNSALGLYQSDGNTSFGTSSVVYVSLPDSSPTCANLGLPSLPSGWSYACSNSTNYRKVDSTGWLPVNLTLISFGSPLDTLPIDPVNTTSTGNYYMYTPGGSWELDALMESQTYRLGGSKDVVSKTGQGNYLYKTGSNLSLSPFNNSGLVGYWKFDEGSGTSASDSSGNGNIGTLTNGPSWTTGKISNALSFDGSNDYVSLPSNFKFENVTYTISALIKTSTINTTVMGQGGRWHGGWNFYLASGKLALYVKQGGLSNFYAYWIGNVAITDNSWHQVVVIGYLSTVNNALSNVNAFYVDGVLDTGTYSGQAPTGVYGGSTEAALIGASGGPDGYATFFNGLIDDVRIYNRALSAAEISAIYNATK